MGKVILDTNILIEILKDNQSTIKNVRRFDKHYISAITKMEIFYGALNKKELEKLRKFVELFNTIPLSADISNTATDLIYRYAKSHTLDIPDSLIAATALDADLPLFTYNKKDFKYIENIRLHD